MALLYLVTSEAPKAASTLDAVQSLMPNLFDISANPMFCVRLTFVSPALPFLVVIIITPAFALVPYIAAAEAPLRTSIFSISFGSRSAILFGAFSSLPLFAPEANLSPEGISLLLR